MNLALSILKATKRELEFLRNLGTHSELVAHDRLALLKSYLRGMSRRKEWGYIDPDEVRPAVIEMIAQLRDVKPEKPFVPLNGHGLFGSRQYARSVRGHRGGSE